MSETIPVRLTPTQTKAIWPGLEVTIQSYALQTQRKVVRYRYDFRTLPPPPAFNKGKYNDDMMNRMLALYQRLRGKIQAGGRLRLDAIDFRAAIFSARTTCGYMRALQRSARKSKTKDEPGVSIDQETIHASRLRAKRTIRSLERHMKRANRQLRNSLGDEDYRIVMDAWKQHVRWMRLYLVYFSPMPAVGHLKGHYQRILDELTDVAVHGLRNQGVEPPEPRELRRIIRMLARSLRREREGIWSIAYIHKHSRTFATRDWVADWVIDKMEARKK